MHLVSLPDLQLDQGLLSPSWLDDPQDSPMSIITSFYTFAFLKIWLSSVHLHSSICLERQPYHTSSENLLLCNEANTHTTMFRYEELPFYQVSETPRAISFFSYYNIKIILFYSTGKSF